jgi:hypothetical protein
VGPQAVGPTSSAVGSWFDLANEAKARDPLPV